jgi:Fur family ferric uptake transcriptional regulator
VKALAAKTGRMGWIGVAHENLDYEGMLRKAGYRVTRQRLIILDAVCEGDGHTTLKQVYSRVREVDGTIDQSPLYRTLKLFVDVGLVVSATTADGETWYEIARPQPHHHLICRSCGGQQEIGHEVVQAMSDMLQRQYDFDAHLDHLVITGVCTACRAKTPRPTSS